MTNRAKKISELAEQTAPSIDDLLVIVDDPSGTATTKKATVELTPQQILESATVKKAGRPRKATVTG